MLQLAPLIVCVRLWRRNLLGPTMTHRAATVTVTVKLLERFMVVMLVMGAWPHLWRSAQLIHAAVI